MSTTTSAGKAKTGKRKVAAADDNNNEDDIIHSATQGGSRSFKFVPFDASQHNDDDGDDDDDDDNDDDIDIFAKNPTKKKGGGGEKKARKKVKFDKTNVNPTGSQRAVTLTALVKTSIMDLIVKLKDDNTISNSFLNDEMPIDDFVVLKNALSSLKDATGKKLLKDDRINRISLTVISKCHPSHSENVKIDNKRRRLEKTQESIDAKDAKKVELESVCEELRELLQVNNNFLAQEMYMLSEFEAIETLFVKLGTFESKLDDYSVVYNFVNNAKII